MATLLLIAAAVWTLARYLNIGQSAVTPGTTVQLRDSKSDETQEVVEYEIVEVARGLDVPWSIVFTSENRMLVTERAGTIREVVDGKLNPLPLIELNETAAVSEAGLMGMDVHPDYSRNGFVYVCLAYREGTAMKNKVERLIDREGAIARDTIIIDDIPSANNHAGCRIKFGPDGKLYITTGDALERSLAQNLQSLAGKILRINDDGSVPVDNPFEDSPIYSYGHRNAQGIAWHASGVMYATEHGPSGFDGPGGGDEVNVIVSGQNYGWPSVSHEQSAEGMEGPVLLFTPAEAPAGAAFYTGDVFPQFKNNLFFTALRGNGIFRVTLDDVDPTVVVAYEKLDINLGRIRDITEGPDGLIYFATSNRDGRGAPRDGDDKIFRFEQK